MIVYQTNEVGVFVGETVAHPSPLEDGVFAIPRGCVTVAPPELGEGEFAVWDGEAWRVELIPAPEPIPEPTPPTLDQVRASAKSAMLLWIDGFLAQFTAGVPAAELASWPVKAERARLHIAGNPQPMIVAEAALTGEDAMALAQKITAKADAYEAIIARVTGLRRATETAIAEAKTPKAVERVLDAAKDKATQMAAQLGVGGG